MTDHEIVNDEGRDTRHLRALCFCVAALLALPSVALAAPTGPVRSSPAPAKVKEAADSPWLLVPSFSVSPKLGGSVGGTAGYMHYFDPESQVSIIGANLQYTTTGSSIAALTSKLSFAADHHRLLALAIGGNIKNDYDDFLGTGQPLKTEDRLRALAFRYQYRVWGDWFVGSQYVNSNYQILGQSTLDNEQLQTLGLTGFEGGGLGLLVNLDSRDNEFSPRQGWLLNVNNIAYRDWLGGDDSYDAYRADLRYYWQLESTVLTFRQNNQWTVDAPSSAYAPISLRGYKFGQYLGQYMSSLETELRLPVAKRWTATAFVGVGCLYGSKLDCGTSDNLYPDVGAGIQYVIKEKEGMVLNLEYAKGKQDNQGVYMKFGYGL